MSNIQFSHVTPIFRIFDIPKAEAFYVDYLGFRKDWDHRFTLDDEGTQGPFYGQISREGFVLHLSEHHGDGSPGANVRVKVRAGGLAEYHAELQSKQYAYLRPAIEQGHTPDSKELQVIDPFGNRITFCEDSPLRPVKA
ncbi:hypothetical protein V2A60_005378 [Cordyceps javanica]|uniref:Bleomycin resistance protein n=1 Tax=Cordyceps javanica TaxID=43265 RepID=A0A545VE34_9HYPO|nr:glyoxalase-likedomain-containing protein [Cordyceps javanica]TQW10364.1 glyoxalase-like domain-containing protein [Cordyceps javanica]